MQLFDKYNKTYGKIFTIWTGYEPTVIVNDPEALREMLITRSADFAGRPKVKPGSNRKLSHFSDAGLSIPPPPAAPPPSATVLPLAPPSIWSLLFKMK